MNGGFCRAYCVQQVAEALKFSEPFKVPKYEFVNHPRRIVLYQVVICMDCTTIMWISALYSSSHDCRVFSFSPGDSKLAWCDGNRCVA